MSISMISVEYYEYYNEIENRRKVIDREDNGYESTLTLWQVLRPFFATFLGTIIVVVVCLLLFLAVCLLTWFDWSRVMSLVEYCPCISHSRLKARFDRLKYPGLYYYRKGRTKREERYDATDDERDLIQEIENRLQT